MLFPPLAGLLGPRLVGALSAVAAAWCAERVLASTEARGARIAAVWFAATTAVNLVTGRLTFALGFALATAAVLALSRERVGGAAALAALATLASPVAGAFLALLVVAWGAARRRWGAAALIAGAALVPALALGVAFPEGGSFPFVASAFFPALAVTLILLALLPREQRVLRLATALYALLLVVAWALPTPMGGNAARLGALLAGPVAAYALWPARRAWLLALTPALLYWQWQTPADDWYRAQRDPSVGAAYYDGLLRFLERRPGPPFRVEVPFTDNHWESARLAPHVPLARGWERQLDRRVNGLFYDGRPLTAARYRRWLDANAVRYVALADAPVDYSAAAEARLVRGGLPYLRPVYRDAHWRVFEVRRPAPIAAGATLTHLGVDDLRLRAPGPGTVRLRVRWTPYWRLAQGDGCVVRDRGWTALRLRRGGDVRLVTSFAPSRIGARSPRCTSAD